MESALLSEPELQSILQAERERLLKQAGLQNAPTEHFKRPVERDFLRKDREKTTILFGGFTWKHEKLIKGALTSLGYRSDYIPTPNVAGFQAGKKYGNNGQCNPTYFTVGNLVNFLQGLEAKGLTKSQICNDFVFVTAGACGPCRFGMYEAEYRLALRNSGFGDFRVMLFQQKNGIQLGQEAGFEMNTDFFMGLASSLLLGDLLNELAYTIRPFEVRPGQTDEVLSRAMDHMYEVMQRHKVFKLSNDQIKKRLGKRGEILETLGKFGKHLFSEHYVKGLRQAAALFDEIECDYTRVKPVVKITGEFWAQTTEGDGNFNMFNFLEREGAQVLVEPIATWLGYMLNQGLTLAGDKRRLAADGRRLSWRREPLQTLKAETAFLKKKTYLGIANALFYREYERLRGATGGRVHALADQKELLNLAHPYYHSRSAGGEGHLEVGKNIYYHIHNLAHMALSLKPFGCMPSTQSDGAQAKVVSDYPDMIFLPLETSGEGEINAHSRTQMALGEAKSKAKKEMETVLAGIHDRTGLHMDDLRAYIAHHPELKAARLHIPHHKGVTGTAANYLLYVSELAKAA